MTFRPRVLYVLHILLYALEGVKTAVKAMGWGWGLWYSERINPAEKILCCNTSGGVKIAVQLHRQQHTNTKTTQCIVLLNIPSFLSWRELTLQWKEGLQLQYTAFDKSTEGPHKLGKRGNEIAVKEYIASPFCNPLTSPFSISDHLEAPAIPQHTDITTHAFIISLKAPCCGKSSAEVAYLSGQSIRQVDRIYARAIKNGFDPTTLLLNLRDDHLKDAPRSRRPKKATEGADKVQDEGIQGEGL
ncbi:unnamed protein product [Fusarium graminearum]|uniref:Chromosome 2, complete genome n=1 Tax=Gibberella zeae (strain ATCC MYA-4620 / CBS 123657 / FGSC 9075 / NRRL 31084 / PH-1) TaxID=229533 RepID=I1S9A8_GIBZE|nr:hypothetical protein FGSG_13438 [Fusarium graminearum PH-1]ESU15267.1 hypothetical protein FGSG_13438 [Fusarium graminearum PH-1]EYB25356.1 hypothetical protein FG05_13438 [Fusarium graminearum]CEF76390.1 unnamed protein product [Fusarium graminearum]CZS79684.1 unnamed protein product [Fusarium graminearum]|eukprot:XP_011320692.1 hypothetical protein FGSG_13438 [Fusarium graminearum PH-1]